MVEKQGEDLERERVAGESLERERDGWERVLRVKRAKGVK